MVKKSETKNETPAPGGNELGAVAGYVRRIEGLETEISVLRGDVKDIYTEAVSNGLSAKGLRMLVAKRKRNAAEQKKLEDLLARYEEAFNTAEGL